MWFFGPWEIPLTPKKSIFRPNFENSYLENGRRFFRQIFGICRPSVYPQNEILKSGVGPQIWAWGGSNFSIGPRARPPSAETVLCSRPGLDRTLDVRLPYNTCPPRPITPETVFPRAPQSGLHFWNFDFFSIFGRLPYPQAGEYRQTFYGDL